VRTVRAVRIVAEAVALSCIVACGGGSPAPSPAPATATTGAASAGTPGPTANQGYVSEVERTTFSSALDVHLDRMSRRPSGLYLQDYEVGTGAVATRGRTVVIRYAGALPNGKRFDAGEITVTLGSNKTIRAWEEGLLGMRVGGKRRLIVPPGLGYGSNGAGEIPPNSVLVFDVEMTGVL